MASTLCPYCHKHSHVTPRWGEVHNAGRSLRVAATCDNCRRLVIAEGNGQNLTDRNASSSSDSSDIARAVSNAESTLTWLPLAAEAPEITDVPPAVGRAAKEAYTSATIGNYMAAILMARTVIESTAKHKGITSGSLASKINSMKDNQLIRPAIADQAHEVRFFGNDMAHGDIDDAPQLIDAEEILALMGEVLAEVFQGPARMERLRARRAGES